MCRVTHTMAKAYKIVAQLFPGEAKPLQPAFEKKEEKTLEIDENQLL
jgi:hypothetical protein